MTEGTALRVRFGRSIGSRFEQRHICSRILARGDRSGWFLCCRAVVVVVGLDDVDCRRRVDLPPTLVVDRGCRFWMPYPASRPCRSWPAESSWPCWPSTDPLIPKSFFTLLVTELTSLDMPPSSAVSPLVMSFASAMVFSNSPDNSADIRRKSRTSFPAWPITSGSFPGPNTSNRDDRNDHHFLRTNSHEIHLTLTWNLHPNGVPVAARTSLKAITTATVAQCSLKYTATRRSERGIRA